MSTRPTDPARRQRTRAPRDDEDPDFRGTQHVSIVPLPSGTTGYVVQLGRQQGEEPEVHVEGPFPIVAVATEYETISYRMPTRIDRRESPTGATCESAEPDFPDVHYLDRSPLEYARQHFLVLPPRFGGDNTWFRDRQIALTREAAEELAAELIEKARRKA